MRASKPGTRVTVKVGPTPAPPPVLTPAIDAGLALAIDDRARVIVGRSSTIAGYKRLTASQQAAARDLTVWASEIRELIRAARKV